MLRNFVTIVLLVTLMLGYVFAPALCADVLITKNGGRFEGEVKEEGGNYILIVPRGGRMVFPKSIVRQVIVSSKALPEYERRKLKTDLLDDGQVKWLWQFAHANGLKEQQSQLESSAYAARQAAAKDDPKAWQTMAEWCRSYELMDRAAECEKQVARLEFPERFKAARKDSSALASLAWECRAHGLRAEANQCLSSLRRTWGQLLLQEISIDGNLALISKDGRLTWKVRLLVNMPPDAAVKGTYPGIVFLGALSDKGKGLGGWAWYVHGEPVGTHSYEASKRLMEAVMQTKAELAKRAQLGMLYAGFARPPVPPEARRTFEREIDLFYQSDYVRDWAPSQVKDASTVWVGFSLCFSSTDRAKADRFGGIWHLAMKFDKVWKGDFHLLESKLTKSSVADLARVAQRPDHDCVLRFMAANWMIDAGKRDNVPCPSKEKARNEGSDKQVDDMLTDWAGRCKEILKRVEQER